MKIPFPKEIYDRLSKKTIADIESNLYSEIRINEFNNYSIVSYSVSAPGEHQFPVSIELIDKNDYRYLKGAMYNMFEKMDADKEKKTLQEKAEAYDKLKASLDTLKGAIND